MALDLRKIEKTILAKIGAIKRGSITPADAKIGIMLNALKIVDEPLYDELMNKYKIVIENLKKENMT